MNTSPTNNSTPPEHQQDAIDQAVEILKRYSSGVRLTQVGGRDSDAAILVTSVGLAVAEQLRRIADLLEVRHE